MLAETCLFGAIHLLISNLWMMCYISSLSSFFFFISVTLFTGLAKHPFIINSGLLNKQVSIRFLPLFCLFLVLVVISTASYNWVLRSPVWKCWSSSDCPSTSCGNKDLFLFNLCASEVKHSACAVSLPVHQIPFALLKCCCKCDIRAISFLSVMLPFTPSCARFCIF